MQATYAEIGTDYLLFCWGLEPVSGFFSNLKAIMEEVQGGQRLLRSDLSGKRAMTATPLPANPNSANYLVEMSKSKVVITRNLVHEAKCLLGERADQLEIVQWQSDLVSDTTSLHVGVQGASANFPSPVSDHGSSRMLQELPDCSSWSRTRSMKSSWKHLAPNLRQLRHSPPAQTTSILQP